MNYENLIEDYIDKYREEIISSLCNLVRIPSVLDSADEKHPYGLQCARSLDFCEDLCKSKGLWTNNEDYIYVEAKLDPHAKGKSILFAAHADVVPAEDENIYSPYGGEVVDNYIVGRGVVDDKGPLIAILYALAFFKENNISLKNNIGLFLGSNEEMGMDDLEHYLKLNPQPDLGIAVDDDFPITNGEKGLIRFTLSGKKSKYIKEAISHGQPQRLKDNVCRIHTLDKIYEEVNNPNAVKDMILNLSQDKVQILDSLESNNILLKVIEDITGRIMNTYSKDEVSGETLLNIYKITSTDTDLIFHFDMRLPVSTDENFVIANLATFAKKYGFILTINKISPSYFISEDDEIVTLLTNLYNKHTNSQDKPYVMGACTYARLFEKGFGFGAGNPHEVKPFPKGHGAAHGPDEAHNIDVLMHAIKIYILGILELDNYFNNKI